MDLQLCRICLKKSATISIFNNEGGIPYSTQIMQCVSVVNITENDGLPSFICTDCVSELYVSFHFYQKCESSDKALRNLEFGKHFFCEESDSKIKLEYKDESLSFDTNSFDDDFLDDFKEEELKVCEIPNEIKKCRKKHKREKIKRIKAVPSQCSMCGLMVSSPSAMKIHLRTHTGEKPYGCPFCDLCFPTKGALKRHTDTYHSKRERKFTCETCGSSFFRKNDIITHMRCHTGEKPYCCPFCPKSFAQINSLIRHKRTHSGDKPYPCPICLKRFNEKAKVTKHLVVHSDTKNYTCHLCSKSVKTKASLTSHMKLHSNEKVNICNYCSISCSTKGNLDMHIRRVHSERSGECTVCLKSFSDLEVHMRRHTGEKPYICDLCSKAFCTKRSLSHHVLFKHENTMKYKCSIGECTKTFPIGSMLEFHLLKHHTNHTPYICQHCSRGFFRTCDLSRHLRVSHMMDVNLKMTNIEHEHEDEIPKLTV